jgi:hypothetical protein
MNCNSAQVARATASRKASTPRRSARWAGAAWSRPPVTAANAASAKLGHAAEQVQVHVRRDNVNGVCGNTRALLAQIGAEQKRGSVTAGHAAALAGLANSVRVSLGRG